MFSAPEFNPNVPAFISKLWHMLSDSSTDDLICWSKEGSSFVIRDQARFSTELLPKYYKHNNMASFIRQLNMYGFHKVLSVESAAMKSDNNELGFSHPYFVSGCPSLLYRIKRKMTNNREIISDFKGDPKLVNKLLHEVQQLQNKQELFDSKLAAMKNENDALWREHSILRQTHAKQQKIVNKLIQFLITLVQQSGLNVKRSPLPLMIKDGGNHSSDPISIFANVQGSPSGPIICEVDPGDVIYEQSENQITCPSDNRTLLITMKTPGNTRSKYLQSSLNKIMPSEDLTGLKPSADVSSKVAEQLSDKPPNKSLMGSKIASKTKTDRKRKYYSVFEDEDLNTPSGLVYLDDDCLSLTENLNEYPQIVQDQTVSSDLMAVRQSDGSGSKESQKNDTSDSNAQISFIDLPVLSSDELVNDITQLKEQSGSAMPESSDDGKGEGKIILQSNIEPDSHENKDLSLVPTDQYSNNLTGEFNNHIEVMQSDLDILKDILKGEGLSLDASTLLQLFSSEDPLALNMITEAPDYEKQSEETGGVGTELIEYPHLFLDEAEPLNQHEEGSLNYSGPDLSIPANSKEQCNQNVCLPQDSPVKYNEP